MLDFHTKLSSVCSTCDHLQLYCTHCVPCSSSHFVSLGPRALVRRLAWFRWCWLFPWLHCVSLCLCFLSRTLASAVVAMKHADIKTYVVLQWKVCTLEVLNVTSLTCVLIYNDVADLSSYEATLEERRWPCSLWKHKLWPHTCNTAVNVWLQCYRLDLLHFSFIQGQEWGSPEPPAGEHSTLQRVMCDGTMSSLGLGLRGWGLVIKRVLASLNERREPKLDGNQAAMLSSPPAVVSGWPAAASLLQVFRVDAGCSGKMTTFSQTLSGVTVTFLL